MTEPKKGTQTYKMLQNMKRKKGTTVRDGFAFSNSPTKLISNLREMGYVVMWEWEHDKDKTTKWKRYWVA